MTRPATNSTRRKGTVRCAIYSRKSSEEGLEQEFNSLQAQREACEAFITSQRHEGWACLPKAYDDGGFSGATTDRPALQRLLADIAAGRVDIVVVYKIDRLTRSLTDFAKIVEILDARDASFVSVTQQFNTTTSMGRLTLNILLSFVQFEREVIGERIRDKIAASKRKGMWMGGVPPLGYRVRDRRLVIVDGEAEIVRTIFRRYAELGSVRLLKEEHEARGIRSKSWTSASGRLIGGKPFSRGALYLMLQNRLYRGEIVHKGRSHPGEHPPIIDQPLWNTVQEQLAVWPRMKDARLGKPLIDQLGLAIAPSSCAWQLRARGPAPGSLDPGSASGACFVGPRFPWSPALAPPTPPPVARLCSSASSLPCRSQTSLDRASAASAPRLPATDYPATTAPMPDPEISRFPR